MSVQTRKPVDDDFISPGPYLAIVTNHLDPTYMGGLEVTLIRSIPGRATTRTSNVIVKYCSPFFGVTPQTHEGNNSSNFNDVQKSYGMWMVPPDVGCTVMVFFIDGDINQGYWFGCVPDMYQNHMVPGIASSQYSAMTEEQLRQYGTRNVPVAEFNKNTRDTSTPNPDRYTKPVHPFADRLVQQGLLIDNVRGITSSSARREVPSRVFGISTPGPVDTSAPLKPAGFSTGGGQGVMMPTSRLGGHQLVMDDGDAEGKNELFRIRTRTGHQILLHNSSDLIYIANSKGTAWIELTSNGKIDIYSQDSISIRSETDFNFRADRDVNIEAGRNINLNAYGGMQLQAVDKFNLICAADGKLQFNGSYNLSVGSDMKISAAAQASIISGADGFFNAGGEMSLSAGGSMKQAAGSSFGVSAGAEYTESASKINMNSGAAPAPDVGPSPETPEALEVFALPNRSLSSGWANSQFYRASDLNSIMLRVPAHEPWDHHENIDPDKFSPSNTDIQVGSAAGGYANPTAQDGDGNAISPTFTGSPVAAPLSRSASANEQYLKNVLIAGGVTDPIKLAAWMAQCKHESGGFRYLKEFASGNAYEGRRDLGNTQPGDGPRFKGRGFIQCTGRNNYASMSRYFRQDFVSNPQLVEQLEWAAKSVLWFFNVYKTPGFKNRTMRQPYRDTTAFWSDIVSVTALVNGGQNGLADRRQAFEYYRVKFTTEGIR